MRLIDADALKTALKSNCKPELCHDYNTAWCESCCQTNDFEDLIDGAPTVDVTALCPVDFPTADDPYPCCSYKRPRGEWEKPFEMNGKSYHKCTNCHISSELILIDKYCPNCGARMQKGGAE